MKMGRPKQTDFPPYMTHDGDRGGFVIRNPLTGRKKRFAPGQEAEARQTAALLAEWIDRERQARALDAGRPTIASLIDRWMSDRMQFMPWDEGTRQNAVYRLKRLRRELGDRVITRTDCLFLDDWLSSFCSTADQFNKWRYLLVLLWSFAVSRKLADTNEPEKIEERSMSKKLAMNQKVRQPIESVEHFWVIHRHAPGWLQIAMEQSLVTLQARTEICSMQHRHYRDGYLFVIRDKTSGDSDMAFIKIQLTEQLEDIRRRSLRLDSSASPYLVHRAPARRRREWTEGKPHWTYINPHYLSKGFAAARDASGLYRHLGPPQRPTFHEVRGLGSRLYLERGMPEGAIQSLMTHANKRTTKIYLDGGESALRDTDFKEVCAPLNLRDLHSR